MRIVGRAVAATAVVAATVVVLPASPTQAAGTYVVNTPDDLVDLVPGDGQCLAAGNVCSLRAAIQEANAAPGTATTITVDPSVPTMALTIGGGGDGDGRDDVGDLDIAPNVDVTIVGNRVTGNQFTGVDASAMSDRHFEGPAGADLRVEVSSSAAAPPVTAGRSSSRVGLRSTPNSMTATADGTTPSTATPRAAPAARWRFGPARTRSPTCRRPPVAPVASTSAAASPGRPAERCSTRATCT